VKPPTEIKLYTKAEREAAMAAWEEAFRNASFSDRRNVSARDDRSLPTRRARVAAFKRTGKVPAGWMTPHAIKFGGIMTDKEAARIVLPRGLTPNTTFADSLRDHVTEQVARRYLKLKGASLKRTTEDRPYGPGSGYVRQVEVWSCGCEVEGTGKYKAATKYGKHEESYEREHVKPCERHKAAFQEREEE